MNYICQTDPQKSFRARKKPLSPSGTTNKLQTYNTAIYVSIMFIFDETNPHLTVRFILNSAIRHDSCEQTQVVPTCVTECEQFTHTHTHTHEIFNVTAEY